MDSHTPPQKQRLSIFLDGTWNTEDDSTNILQAHALMHEGEVEGNIIQKRYYDRGVGTGLLDSVVGGGFGLGLEVNVREAYNWLVDHYNDGDEIYIFGFSRGAYSARSLVGFISTCGLLRRGAPLTNSQLWSGYVQISRHRGDHKTWKETIFGPPKLPFSRISKKIARDKRSFTDHLLREWSRRVDITYLGIFDTVGAMGLEALGISGIRSSSGLNHNQNPTTLILNCRHALAIDEYRGSFRLTPLLDYVAGAKREDKQHYKNKIFQKWFVGSHSNVGGGYDNNLLAAFPLKWILEGAMKEGLAMDELLPSKLPAKIEQKNDSYLDFSGIVWPHIFREKRYYRQINRDDMVVASIPNKKNEKEEKTEKEPNTRENDEPDKVIKKDKSIIKATGFSLRSINEEVDQSVIDLTKSLNDESYAPLSLINYANNTTLEKPIENDFDLNGKATAIIQLLEKTIDRAIEKGIKKGSSKKREKAILKIIDRALGKEIEIILEKETGIIKDLHNELTEEISKFLTKRIIHNNWTELNDKLKKEISEVIVKEIKKEIDRRERKKQVVELFKDRKPNEKWLENSAKARLILVLWATMAAFGVGIMRKFFLVDSSFIDWETLASIAVIFVIADWGEFFGNIKLALNPLEIRTQAVHNILMWIRLTGIVLFFIGVFAFVNQCWNWGWTKDLSSSGVLNIVLKNGWINVPIIASIFVFLFDFGFNGVEKSNGEPNLKLTLYKFAATIFSAVFLLLAGLVIFYSTRCLIGFSSGLVPTPIENFGSETLIGKLLLIQVVIFMGYYTMIWVGTPTRKTRITSAITDLQIAFSPTKIQSLFNDWEFYFSRRWIGEDKRRNLAWTRLREVLREVLWRDIIGFIPIYSITFGITMWLGSNIAGLDFWSFLSEEIYLGMPNWGLIIIITAVADYIENTVHLKYIRDYKNGSISAGLVIIGGLFTLIKTIGFLSSLIFTVGILISLTWKVMFIAGGLKWLIAMILTLVIDLIFLSILIKFGRSLFYKKK